MAYTYDQIIELARLSGIPFTVGSTLREGDRAKSGNLSWHHYGQAVDFMGESQDDLAKFFMAVPSLEILHQSKATGTWYGWNGSRGRPIDPAKNPDLVKEHENHLHVAMSPEQVGPGSVLDQLRRGAINVTQILAGAVSKGVNLIGGVTSVVPKTVTEALGVVGTAASSLATSAMSIGKLADLATKAFLPGKLLRGAAFLLGTMMLLIGIWFLAREVKESNA